MLAPDAAPPDPPGPPAPGPEGGERLGRFVLSLFAVGLASRVLVVALGAILYRGGTPAQGPPSSAAAEIREEPRVVRAWYQWDGFWYAKISRDGYQQGEAGEPSPTVAFFPMLPLIMAAAGAIGIDRYAVGLIAPNLAFAAGLPLLGLIALRATGSRATAWRSCLLLTAYPWSLFFSAPYHDAFGFALGSAALLAWISERPAAAAVSLGLASAARQTAPALSAGIALQWIADVVRRRPPRRWSWTVAILGTAGMLGFFGYLYLEFGDPMLALKVQRLAQWNRKSPSPGNLIHLILHPPVRASQWRDLAVAWMFLGLGVRAWIKRGPLWGGVILVPVLQAMSTGTYLSIGRLALGSTAAFVDLGDLLRNRYVLAAWLLASAAIQVFFIRRFINADWVA